MRRVGITTDTFMSKTGNLETSLLFICGKIITVLYVNFNLINKGTSTTVVSG
jgi:hypothetical protein